MRRMVPLRRMEVNRQTVLPHLVQQGRSRDAQQVRGLSFVAAGVVAAPRRCAAAPRASSESGAAGCSGASASRSRPDPGPATRDPAAARRSRAAEGLRRGGRVRRRHRMMPRASAAPSSASRRCGVALEHQQMHRGHGSSYMPIARTRSRRKPAVGAASSTAALRSCVACDRSAATDGERNRPVAASTLWQRQRPIALRAPSGRATERSPGSRRGDVVGGHRRGGPVPRTPPARGRPPFGSSPPPTSTGGAAAVGRRTSRPYWRQLDRLARRDPRAAPPRPARLFYDDAEFRQRYGQCPASTAGHHAELGGLLRHTCEVAAIGGAIAAACGADADLVLAGALLHDIGKLEAYSWSGGVRDDRARRAAGPRRPRAC